MILTLSPNDNSSRPKCKGQISAMCRGFGGLESWMGLVGDQSPQRKWGQGPGRKAVFTMFPGKLQSKGLARPYVLPSLQVGSQRFSVNMPHKFGITTTRSPPSCDPAAPCSGASCGRVCSAKVRRWVLLLLPPAPEPLLSLPLKDSSLGASSALQG